MFKLLLKNPKRIVRNLTIIFIGYIVATAVFILAALFVPKEYVNKLPLFAIIGITSVGLMIVMFLIIAVIGHFANKKDSENRRRYKAEVNSINSTTILEASGVNDSDAQDSDESDNETDSRSSVNTNRSTKEIKKELKKLQTELYHAQERDSNLKLGKKF